MHNRNLNAQESLSARFIGCFVDKGLRDLPESMGVMTTDECLEACRNGGYTFIGRQYYDQCFCGDNFGKYGSANDCGNGCLSQTGFYGGYRNCVFRTSSPTSTSPSTSMPPTNLPSASNSPSSSSPTTAPEKINEQICLESRHTCSFSITDSFGDGLCYAEGSGSYELKVGEHVIAEGGDFGKSEKFWFTFHDCLLDSDCDDGDYRTMSTCKIEATACLHRPRPCDEYGQIISINVTTLNFPEATGWKIKDHNGDVQLEGGHYELLLAHAHKMDFACLQIQVLTHLV